MDKKLLLLFAQESATIAFPVIIKRLASEGKTLSEIKSNEKIVQILELLKYDPILVDQVYESLIYIWAFQGTYSIEHFLKKFKEVPDSSIDEKSIYILCGQTTSGPLTSPEMIALNNLIKEKYASAYHICSTFKQLGTTPKERVVSALENLKKEWTNQRELTDDWGVYENKTGFNC